MPSLLSQAEQNAESATSLPSLPINLGEVKRTVAEILSQFGKSLMFHEYTTHDISHVDDMLTTIDWLIPKETRAILSKAEWLMIVLAIYFHDMGLVVTEQEFQKRSASGFQQFCAEKLFASSDGADYRNKVDTLSEELRERFLYQEFVRANHARRVKAWVEGRTAPELGYAAAQVREVDRLLSPLDNEFRRDLGLVCESHNLDDLHDVAKYRLSHPYGNSDDETVNIQYCAIILRTVDLLQITKRRTPSVLYRLIDPSDPISQLEWAKQGAVKRVRAKLAVDRDGVASASLSSDTVEVFASLTEDSAYFGLTSYLRYASSQLAASYDIVQKSLRLTPRPYKFPWRYVDDANVQVEGALNRPFGFEIDQGKILDLLTGHTLYNDSNVVVRELVQNSIDAVRLQATIDHSDPTLSGRVHVSWNSQTSDLTITDNGTGMTQEVIEKHLLKVGSSRYQDPKFREKFPNFSPISRFGIGVLSSFMVADSVEIVTASTEEEHARRISLRSVHGKYLIRLLDKTSDPAAVSLGPHGTSFRIRFRPSARRLDVLDTVRQWILFPRCQVTATIDENPTEQIGYPTPKSALEAFLAGTPGGRAADAAKVKVEERTINGITLAYALRFSAHFRDWSFIGLPQSSRRPEMDVQRTPICTCIEGIAVEFETPGFRGTEILSIANAIGNNAPKTNVARSSLEATDEREQLAGTIYKILFEAVVAEARRLRVEEAYSLTWSTEQIPYLLAPALSGRTVPQYRRAHEAALEHVPMFLVEVDDKRVEKSLVDLTNISWFWTVESVLARSVEDFIREAKAEVTARDLIVVSQGTASSLPTGPILANNRVSEVLRTAISSKFQVTQIDGNLSERRIDIKWSLGTDKWISSDSIKNTVNRSLTRELSTALQLLGERGRRSQLNIYIPLNADIPVSGLDDHFGVTAHSTFFLLPNTPLSCAIAEHIDLENRSIDTIMEILVSIEAIGQSLDGQRVLYPALVDRFYRQFEGRLPDKWLRGQTRLSAAMAEMQGSLKTFNPLSWAQRSAEVNLPI